MEKGERFARQGGGGRGGGGVLSLADSVGWLIRGREVGRGMLCVEKSCEYLAVRGMVRLFWEWGRGFGGGCGGGVMVGICYLVVMSWISITEQGYANSLL